MAPIKKRTSMRAKIAASSKPKPASAPGPSASESIITLHPSASEFSNTKKDKRAIKHNALISRIEKTNKKPLKRRRPGKKLVTELEGLVDALPDLEDDEGEWEGIDEDENMEGVKTAGLKSMVRVRKSEEGKMRMKTLKSRPGAAKRKAALEGREMERFRANMVGMTPTVGSGTVGVAAADVGGGGGNQAAPAAQTGDRWAALRGFIGQTLEQNSAFGKK